MKYFIKLIAVLILFYGCESKSQNNGYENFTKELRVEIVNKIENNSPYSYSEKIITNFKHYPYFKKFGNSGICIQFDLDGDSDRFKNYKSLDNNYINYDSSSHVYNFSNENLTVKTPELSDEFGELSSIDIIDENEIDIYLIEKGQMSGVFVNQEDKQNYNYSIGIYLFKNHSKIIYWCLIY